MPSIQFSRIVILESLEKDKTGRKLYDDLRLINIQHDRNIEVIYSEVGTKKEFLAKLISLKQEAEEGHWPILHFECHGKDDTTGISLANGEIMSWAELKPYLTAINIATQCNLLVVMAACYGGHMVQIIQPIDRAPCLALLSPTNEIYPDEILKPLTAFYTELLNSLNLNAALNKLRSYPITDGGYDFKTAPDFFQSVYVGYIKGCSDQKAFKIKHRVKNMYMELKKSGISPHGGLGAIKKILKQSQPEYFKWFYKNFFMTDLFPENKLRFNITFPDLQEKAEHSKRVLSANLLENKK